MHPIVFSRSWFARYQRPLLTVLNAPVIGGELRDALGIRRHDLGGDRRRRIVCLLPHAYVVANGNGSFTIDVRTHAKYAKRLRHQFDTIWRAAHAWDRFVANPLVPALNLGFDTLTKSPDPNPEATSVDGQMRRASAGESFAAAVGGAGTSADDTSALESFLFIQAAGASYVDIDRSIFLFDTSALTSAATISAAVLSLFANTVSDTSGKAPTMNIFTSTPASNTALVAADYSQIGTTPQSTSVALGSLSTSAYTDFALNGTGLGNVSTTGVSKFGVREAAYDATSTDPLAGDMRVVGNFADQTGSANDPKLVVTFSWPAAALTGTVTGGITPADIIAGGKTIILTLTGDTFIA